MQDELLAQARVLVVDDDAQNVRYIKDVLEWAGYKQVRGTTQPTEVLSELHQYRPDLILLDLIMPAMDGYEVMEVLQEELPPDSYLPILVLTSDTSQEAKRRALSHGAKDFLTKPFSPTEIRHRVSNLLETRFLYLKCKDQAALLESRRAGDGSDGGTAADEWIDRLARVGSYQADPTGERARRVGAMSSRLARALGQPEPMSRLLARAARLYDVGMAARSESGNLGPGEDSGEVFPAHAEIGAQLLSGSSLPELQAAAEIALSHHERWDGTGFPAGLRGQEIPLNGRIVAVALAFELAYEAESGDEGDAMQRALARVESEAGGRYDPTIVDALSAALVGRAGAAT